MDHLSLTNYSLTENVYFAVIILDNLEQYFEVNANYSAELNLKASLKPHVQLNLRKPGHFLNSNVARVLVFDNSGVHVTTERAPNGAVSDLNWLEIEYKHSVVSSSLWHQCVHWDTNRK